jgi:threonine dehydratase
LFQIVIEGASGAALAGVLSETMKQQDASLKNVACVLTGGNVDIDDLPWYREEFKE